VSGGAATAQPSSSSNSISLLNIPAHNPRLLWKSPHGVAIAVLGLIPLRLPAHDGPHPEQAASAAASSGWLLALLGISLCAVVAFAIWAFRCRRDLARERARFDQAVQERTRELEQRVSEERRAADEAAHSTRARNAFLVNVSHELRTPMNAILGMNGLLLDTDLSPQQRELADAVQTSGEALLTIVNDLLDLSRIECGKLAIEETDLHLRQVIESALEVASGRAHEKGIELACLVRQDIPTHLRGDPNRIRQVLLNLVSNAVKFTERGEVLVEAQLVGEENGFVEVRIDVHDTGIGMTAATLANLFQPFAQADSTPSRRFGGAGVGLAISERLVELMGGKIGASSQLGEGSTFWFTLRLIRPEEPVQEHAVKWHSRMASLSVLVASRNAANRRVIDYHLAGWSVRRRESVETVVDAVSTLRAAAQADRPFDLLIIDETLDEPGPDELARRVRTDHRLRRTRLVLLTPLTGGRQAEQMRRAGFDAWTTKPVRQSHLLNAIVRLFGASDGSELTLTPVTPARIGQADPDLAGLRVLVAEDNPPNQVFARRLMLRLGFEALVVDNGRLALEALARQPFDIVLMDCHMPQMDGFEATRRIRNAGEFWSGIPIIAVTADAIAGSREACIAAGMDDFVSKPLKTDELLKAIRRARSSKQPEVPLDGAPQLRRAKR
jgi:two-component system sensor histidine kinase/response regulator